ncbi:MAG: hypothetical protein H6581_03955 [Bacteroidia bacterium]|nr:hypothetical protein [Bacteroidia bacterium]
MNSKPQINTGIFFPWNPETGFTPHHKKSPNFGELYQQQIYQKIEPIPFETDPLGGFHFLLSSYDFSHSDTSPTIFHFNREGKFTGKTQLTRPALAKDFWEIKSWKTDGESNIYLLEEFAASEGDIHQVRLIEMKNGIEKWATSGPDNSGHTEYLSFTGTGFDGISIEDKKGLFVFNNRESGKILVIDPENGKISELIELDQAGTSYFKASAHEWVYPTYFSEKRLRGIGRFNSESQEKSSKIGDENLFGLLLYPLGMAPPNQLITAYPLPFGLEGRINAININDFSVQFLNLGSFAFSADGKSVNMLTDSALVHFMVGEPPHYTTLSEPVGNSKSELAFVNENGNFVVHTGEEPGKPGIMKEYSSNGHLANSFPAKKEFLEKKGQTPGIKFWRVNSNGVLLIPLINENGIGFVELSF